MKVRMHSQIGKFIILVDEFNNFIDVITEDKLVQKTLNGRNTDYFNLKINKVGHTHKSFDKLNNLLAVKLSHHNNKTMDAVLEEDSAEYRIIEFVRSKKIEVFYGLETKSGVRLRNIEKMIFSWFDDLMVRIIINGKYIV